MSHRSRVYLDWAAGAPVSPLAKQALLRGLSLFGNPSGTHEEGRRAHVLLEEARTTIARELEVKPSAIVFTANATEANALAILGTVRSRQCKGMRLEDMHMLYLSGAHPSVVKTIESLVADGMRADTIPCSGGAIDMDALTSLISAGTVLISLEAVGSETGLRIDTRSVQRMLSSSGRKKILLHVDGSQMPLVESVGLTHLGADLLTLDAQKIGGVRGIGILAFAREATPDPIVYGGGQEQGVRPGTETPALASSFAVALVKARMERVRFARRAAKDRAFLIDALQQIPEVYINEGKRNVPHILNISLMGRDTDYLVSLLNERGFAVSTKSACETVGEAPSRAVYMLTGSRERASATLRISWGPRTKSSDLKRFVKVLTDTVSFLDQHAA